jgi:hypothetical protein
MSHYGVQSEKRSVTVAETNRHLPLSGTQSFIRPQCCFNATVFDKYLYAGLPVCCIKVGIDRESVATRNTGFSEIFAELSGSKSLY